jgi:hypothetical protein
LGAVGEGLAPSRLSSIRRVGETRELFGQPPRLTIALLVFPVPARRALRRSCGVRSTRRSRRRGEFGRGGRARGPPPTARKAYTKDGYWRRRCRSRSRSFSRPKFCTQMIS